ncbi:MAG: MFS transporter [Candidatus Thorarchaeota archaeon]|nr:MFS transporter [Candidatus Thorarchaeota archaeon]
MEPRDSIDDLEMSDTEEKTKSIILLGILTLLTITGAAVLHVNQPEFILDRFVNISEFEYSLFDTTLYLSYLIVGLFTGALSDRWKSRRVFIFVGTSGSMLFYLLMTTTISYPLLLVYRFLQGSFTVMIWQTLMTMVLDLSGSESRGKSMGIFGAFLAIGMGLGPAVGGVIASYGVFWPYYFACILNIVVLVATLVALKEPALTKNRPSLAQSLSIARRRPELVIPGLFNFIDRLHIGFILTALPLLLSVVLGLSESLRGMALAIFALPFIILQYPMGKVADRYGRYLPLIVGSLGFGSVMSVLGFVGSTSFVALLIMLIFLGIFSGVTAPASMALIGDYVPQDDSAMGMGLFNFMGNLGITVGPVLFGILIITTDFVVAFFAAGLLEVVTLGICAVLVRFFSLRERRMAFSINSTS